MINVAAQIAPRTRTHTLCEAAQSKCMSTCRKSHQKSHFIQKITGKTPRPRTRTNTLCEPAQSKCMSTCHKRHQKGHLTREFTGKMPQLVPYISPKRLQILGGLHFLLIHHWYDSMWYTCAPQVSCFRASSKPDSSFDQRTLWPVCCIHHQKQLQMYWRGGCILLRGLGIYA